MVVDGGVFVRIVYVIVVLIVDRNLNILFWINFGLGVNY